MDNWLTVSALVLISWLLNVGKMVNYNTKDIEINSCLYCTKVKSSYVFSGHGHGQLISDWWNGACTLIPPLPIDTQQQLFNWLLFSSWITNQIPRIFLTKYSKLFTVCQLIFIRLNHRHAIIGVLMTWFLHCI